MGSASAAELVQAVEKAGYGAEAIEDDLQRRERQQETALATMKRFRWQAIVALLVGVPVMVWGMIGDNADGQRRQPFACGWLSALSPSPSWSSPAATLPQRVESLKNGTATMDTLVALGTRRRLAVLDERQPVAAVVPDGSPPSLLRSHRDDYRPD